MQHLDQIHQHNSENPRLLKSAIPSKNLRGCDVDERIEKRTTKTAEKARSKDTCKVSALSTVTENEPAQEVIQTLESDQENQIQTKEKDSKCNCSNKIDFLSKKCQETEKKLFRFENLTDQEVQQYTNITKHSFTCLQQLICEFKPFNYWYSFEVKSLNENNQLLLCLMKLKLDMPLYDLSNRFKISRTTVQNIFMTYLHVIHEVLFKGMMKDIPSIEKNQSCLPESFGDFANCRIILDCTEFNIEKPRTDLNAAGLTYSNYKHNLTAKFLIGVAPNGAITFVSDGYPGSVSDKMITADSGVMKHMKVSFSKHIYYWTLCYYFRLAI